MSDKYIMLRGGWVFRTIIIKSSAKIHDLNKFEYLPSISYVFIVFNETSLERLSYS